MPAIFQLLTDKSNVSALRVLLAAVRLSIPVDVQLNGSFSRPCLQRIRTSSKVLEKPSQMCFTPSEMLRHLLHAQSMGEVDPSFYASFGVTGQTSSAGSAKIDGKAPCELFTMEQESILDFEMTTLACGLIPLYKERTYVSGLDAALKELEGRLEGEKKGKGVVLLDRTSASAELLPGSEAAGNFCVRASLFAALTPAFCTGGLLTNEQQQALPLLSLWFKEFKEEHEDLLDTVYEMLGVQEVDDFIRAPRRFELSPQLPKFYATTPIYYVNAAPHIGHVYSTLIVDVLGRYHRVKGERTFVTTGTDEHGQKVAEAASKKGMDTYEFTTSVANEFKECFQLMDIRTDMFTRTTNPHHYQIVQDIWRKLEAKGDIFLGTYHGWYSVSDEMFLTAQNVIDGVNKEGKPCKISAESGHEVTLVSEENYFFRLSAFRDRLLQYYRENPDSIVPEFRRRDVIRTVEKGLEDLSISRKKESVLNWAIPVPGSDTQCIYVWLDALFGYFSNVSVKPKEDGSDGYEIIGHEAVGLWPADVHVVGKDILKFHAIYWPAFLMSAGLPLPKKLLAHGWWTKDKKKISKSLGNAFDPVEKANEFGIDALKYFLLRESNFADDGDYSDANMIARLNGELADTLGNLAMRCVSQKINVDQQWPTPSPNSYTDLDEKLICEISALSGTVDHYYLLPDIQKALIAIFDTLRALNGYMTENAPWKLVSTDPTRLKTVLYLVMEGLRVSVTMLQPVMPQKCKAILNMLGVPEAQQTGAENFRFGAVKGSYKVNPLPEGEVLFSKVQK